MRFKYFLWRFFFWFSFAFGLNIQAQSIVHQPMDIPIVRTAYVPSIQVPYSIPMEIQVKWLFFVEKDQRKVYKVVRKFSHQTYIIFFKWNSKLRSRIQKHYQKPLYNKFLKTNMIWKRFCTKILLRLIVMDLDNSLKSLTTI